MASDISAMTTMTILLGTNGTGKTTATKNIARQFGGRVLVVTPDDREWTEYPMTELRIGHAEDFQYAGIRRHIWNDKHTLQVLQYFSNGMIIFDDCRSYLRSNTSDEIRRLMIRRRQQNVHILASGHGFTEVPPVMFTFCTDFILFKTRDNIKRREPYMRNFEAVKAKQEDVNAIADGHKEHPKDYNVKEYAGKKAVDIHYCDHIANE